MVDFVDIQYATQLASRFQRFQVKHRNPLKINFRCPICGDSKKSKTKSRGWINEISATNHLHYSCFNCGVSLSFDKFAKQMDPLLYNDYVAEKYLKKASGDIPASTDEKAKTRTPKFNRKILSGLKKVSQLRHDHPAKKYIESRKIPPDQHYRIYYSPKFMTWVNTVIPGKFSDVKKDEPRLVIPLYDTDGNVLGVSSRGFNPKGMRYITIMFQEDAPKVFGLDEVDFSKKYYVTEGAFDAMFLSNSIAMVGADAKFSALKNTENAVFVHDAERRNKEIVSRMGKLLDKGYKVCIWPVDVPDKDINAMLLKGMSNVQQIIDDNTFEGLYGQLKLKEWKQV